MNAPTMDRIVGRDLDLPAVVAQLKADQVRKVDVVVPSTAMKFVDGQLEVKGVEPVVRPATEATITEDGVFPGQPAREVAVDGTYRPTETFLGHTAGRLDIPVKYVHRMYRERSDIFDATTNGWLRGRNGKMRPPTHEECIALGIDGRGDGSVSAPQGWYWDGSEDRTSGQWWIVQKGRVEPDGRKHLLRLFQANDTSDPIARAWMSNRFAAMDNLDGLLAMLEGLQMAGIDPAGLQFRGDIGEKRMSIKVDVPEIAMAAPELLKGYRNPFGNDELGAQREAAHRGLDIDQWREVARREGLAYSPEEGGEPIVNAGLRFDNSEVGAGRYQLRFVIGIQVCKNGLVIEEDGMGKRHVGGALEDGTVDWSSDTIAKSLQVVSAQTRDLVKAFMTPAYLAESVAKLEEKTGKPISRPDEAIKAVSKKFGFSEQAEQGILAHFIAGGQATAGGLMNAITSFSQTVLNPDVAYELDSKAVRVLDLV